MTRPLPRHSSRWWWWWWRGVGVWGAERMVTGVWRVERGLEAGQLPLPLPAFVPTVRAVGWDLRHTHTDTDLTGLRFT